MPPVPKRPPPKPAAKQPAKPPDTLHVEGEALFRWACDFKQLFGHAPIGSHPDMTSALHATGARMSERDRAAILAVIRQLKEIPK